MMGTLSNLDQLGTVVRSGSMMYTNASYVDDSDIQQTGLSLGAVGTVLSCFNGLWAIADNSGVLHIVQGGQVSCKIASVTPDKDEIGNQLETGVLTYTNLAINPPFLKFASNPLIAWISPMNIWGWVTVIQGGGV